jgi:hypothetical protein
MKRKLKIQSLRAFAAVAGNAKNPIQTYSALMSEVLGK